jgi:hypothetical protein
MRLIAQPLGARPTGNSPAGRSKYMFGINLVPQNLAWRASVHDPKTYNELAG